MRHRNLVSSLLWAFVVLLLTAGTGAARTWVEEDFWPREVKTYAFTPPTKPGPDSKVHTVIGETSVYKPEKGDTFFDLARYFDLGYNEIQDANPGVDEWIPGHFDKQVIVPQQFVLPNGSYSGHRHQRPRDAAVLLPPGRQGRRRARSSPSRSGSAARSGRRRTGKFTVREKTVNPTWNIPESIRKERIADHGFSETMIPGGDPKNPLGKYRMRLTLDLLRHPRHQHSVGRRHAGEPRLRAPLPRGHREALSRSFRWERRACSSTSRSRWAWRDGRVFVEVHKDMYGMKPGMYREARAILEQQGVMSLVDEDKLREAVLAQSGIPVDVTARRRHARQAPAGSTAPRRDAALGGQPRARPGRRPRDRQPATGLRALRGCGATAVRPAARGAPSGLGCAC